MWETHYALHFVVGSQFSVSTEAFISILLIFTMFIYFVFINLEESLISDDPAISDHHPSNQLQQKDSQQPDFLSSKPEPNIISGKPEPDFFSSKPDTSSRTTDFFNLSQADRQRQKEAKTQISPEVKHYMLKITTVQQSSSIKDMPSVIKK